jgi:DNA invertase Pin-like site-specific DNA recombinase
MTNKSTRPSSSVIGYLRVSTADQNLEKNKADILQLANHHDLGRVRFVEETVSGRISWRNRKLAEVLGSLEANDAIIVSELSRLGRSMLEYMEILSIAAQKRINVYSVKGAWRLDQSIQSKIIAMAFSMAAEIERDLISQRTKEALRRSADLRTLSDPLATDLPGPLLLAADTPFSEDPENSGGPIACLVVVL